MLIPSQTCSDMADSLNVAAEACRSGNIDSLQQILAHSPDIITTRSTSGDTLLGLACRAATGEIAIPPDPGTPEQHQAVDIILQAGADPNAVDEDGWGPLHTAAMAGHADLATRLLASGATREGHLYSASGGSALALALFYAKTDMGEVLSPSVPDNLRHAAALGENLARFFERGQLTDQAIVGLDFYAPLVYFPKWQRRYSREEVLNEALTWAARNGQIESMQTLIDLGADVNSNPYRGTPLLWAIYSADNDAASWLLERGADPNLRHDFGGEGHGVNATALHLAAQFNSLDYIKLLLDRGADPTIVDAAHGGDAIGWATFSGASEAAALIKEFMGEH